ncbi:hypothetical protein ACFWNE_18835, partial [Streptomyces goshikiensis]
RNLTWRPPEPLPGSPVDWILTLWALAAIPGGRKPHRWAPEPLPAPRILTLGLGILAPALPPLLPGTGGPARGLRSLSPGVPAVPRAAPAGPGVL